MTIETEFSMGDTVYSRQYDSIKELWFVVKKKISSVQVEVFPARSATSYWYSDSRGGYPTSFVAMYDVCKTREEAEIKCNLINKELLAKKQKEDDGNYRKCKKFIKHYESKKEAQ